MSEVKKIKPARFKIKKILNPKVKRKDIIFIIFLSGLGVLNIANVHYATKTITRVELLSNEVKELQYEYKSLNSEVMFRSKQSEVAKALESFGLKELSKPPVVLKDSSKIKR